ncbi:hypothetical protein ACFOUP_18410 [Belliella kenyensis]|uniref:Uncharacterized protein n=1 Tax=Belliella kenyensis TaxID=1472724 RepID=A0ABV8EQ25_9BACT|nr:hypothetical protein [Belliella kenyensis]MCH7402249.1 hypothetical protein [Belliella kenyensis]MDN3601763.1 hypothetical protein [Belliella kenyensis]
MKSEEFIKKIKTTVSKGAISDVLDILESPAGRNPEKELLEISKWYNNLNQKDKFFIERVIEMSVDTSVFGFLYVLDEVRAIENSPNKGSLKLYYSKDKISTLLNNHDMEYLHDLYNSL